MKTRVFFKKFLKLKFFSNIRSKNNTSICFRSEYYYGGPKFSILIFHKLFGCQSIQLIDHKVSVEGSTLATHPWFSNHATDLHEYNNISSVTPRVRMHVRV